MSFPETSRPPQSLYLALIISLLLHGLVLLIPTQPPRGEERAVRRLEASFTKRSVPPVPLEIASAEVVPTAKPARPLPPQKKILALDKGQGRATTARPKWSVAEREEMNAFLRELESQAPSLAQRSLAAAGEIARHRATRDDDGSEVLERLPNSPPVDPFSLEMYLDSLVRKLNQSARFVRSDPRSRGVRNAALEIRINPDGSLKSFKVLNAADQQAEIEFVRSVVDRTLPFAAFPPDIGKSARSLGMLICIMPASSVSGGFGFSRNPDGRHC